MEFPFNVNEILPETVTLVDENLAPFREKFKHDRVSLNSRQKELKHIIDLMGEASAKAQNLKASITSAMRLATSDHRLYILKDPQANNGLGAVIGIIKIGHKKLFVLDYHGNQYEVNPLCVLDFYIHESKQRTGCGKTLFEYMLKMEGIEPGQLAVDRPSHKFLSFLKKHYNLDHPIPQVNNFVVYAEFFRDLEAVGLVSGRHQRLSGNNSKDRPPLYPYKRPVENEYLLSKRRAVSHQVPVNHPPSSRKESTNGLNTSQPMVIDNTRTGSSEAMATNTMATDTSRNSQSNDDVLKEMEFSLPPLAPRPPGRHSASRSQVGSAGSRWILESSLSSGPSGNSDRGLAARATSYSRYNTSREMSAPEIRRRLNPDEKGQLDSFERVSSGGRKRNLHLTSAGNPLQVAAMETKQAENNRPPANALPDVNANEPSKTPAANPSFISSTGNYSVSQMYNSYYGPKRSFGTGWNIFGVPPGTNYGIGSSSSSRRNPSRTFPY